MVNTSKKVGIGIIGLDHWYWALSAAYNISLNPNAKLIAIAEPREEFCKKVAEVYNAETYYTDYHKLLENERIDGVVITTTTDMHTEVALEAAKAGKNILIGKPIARTLQEARKIVASSKLYGVKLMAIGSGILPNDPIKKFIDDGVIGKPFAANASIFAILPLREPGVNEPGWFINPYKAAGGGFIDHAVYLAALLRGYLDSEVTRVYAEMGKFVYRDYNVEDHGIAILRFANGSIGTIESTFTSVMRTHNFMRIIGTKGEMEITENTISILSIQEKYKRKISVEMLSPNPVFERNYVEKAIPFPPFAAKHKPVIDEYIKCLIEKDREPTLTGEDAYKVLEICLAAYLSIKEKKPIELPLKTEVDVPSILSTCL
ncbi:MAG: Gfo/Idh/MocA family oxidoreductase [Nitrososphaeria archaeon]